MLRYVLAVVTASVSLAGCNASSEPAGKTSHTVKRPVMDEPTGVRTSPDQAGSPSATPNDSSASRTGQSAAATGSGQGQGVDASSSKPGNNPAPRD